MKKFNKTLAMTAGFTSIVLTVGCFAGCNWGGNPNKEDDSVVSMDINPGVELIVDKNEVIVGVYGTNTDGQVLLYGETETLKGKKLDEAVEKITRTAVELGYITEDNKVVQYTVSSSNEGKQKALGNKISASVSATVEELNLSFQVQTDAEVAYHIYRRYEAFIAEHPEYANAVTVEEFKLAYTASETGEVSLEAAVELNAEELIQIVSDAGKQVEEYATKAFNVAKTTALAVYDQAAATVLDSVYATYYLTNFDMTDIAGSVNSVYLGATYTAYQTAGRVLNAVADKAQAAAAMVNDELTPQQTAAVLTAFGLEQADVALLQNEEGKVTIASVDAYANKLFKNSQAGQELEQVKAQLTTVMNNAEAAYNQAKADVIATYGAEIEALKTDVAEVVAQLENIEQYLPQTVKTHIAELKTSVNKIVELTQDGFAIADINELASFYQEKAKVALAAIEEDLTDEEKEEVAKKQASAEQSLTLYRLQLENALNQAETDAKTALQQLRTARENVNA